MNWRKWNRIIHRDLGYFFFGMTLIYTISGIAINHLDIWNPKYIIENREVTLNTALTKSQITKDYISGIFDSLSIDGRYKKHYYPADQLLKVFFEGGSLTVDMKRGIGTVETVRRRPVFHGLNYLHYNPKHWWTLFSDMFAIGLILIAISGLFMIKGKHGIKCRGAWVTIAGLLIPLLFLLMYY